MLSADQLTLLERDGYLGIDDLTEVGGVTDRPPAHSGDRQLVPTGLLHHLPGFGRLPDQCSNIASELKECVQSPEFVARNAINPVLELKDWREWRNLWYEARATLADGPLSTFTAGAQKRRLVLRKTI